MKPVRKRTRLSGFDYTSPGSYFITLVVKDRECVFGDIALSRMQLNLHGQIIQDQWEWLHRQYSYVHMDEYVVMPNHFHGIINLGEERNGHDHSLQKMKPLSQLIGAFKTTSSKRIHESGLNSFQWQSSFYDHIIHNEKEMERIREYIQTNPLRWELDIECGEAVKLTPKAYYDEVFGL